MFKPEIVVFSYSSLVDDRGQIINPEHIIPFLQNLAAHGGILAITANGLDTSDEIRANLAQQGINIPPEQILSNPADHLRIEDGENWIQVNVAEGAPEHSSEHLHVIQNVIQMLLQRGYYPDVKCPIRLPDGTVISSIKHGGDLKPYDVRDIRLFDYSQQNCKIAQAVGINAIHTNTPMLLVKVKKYFTHLKSALERDDIQAAKRCFSDIQRNAPRALDRFIATILPKIEEADARANIIQICDAIQTVQDDSCNTYLSRLDTATDTELLFNVEFSFRILQYIFSNLHQAHTAALLEQFRFVEQQFQHMHDARESGVFVCRHFIRTVDDQVGALREAMIERVAANDRELAAHLSRLTRIRPPSKITSANELAVCVVDAAKQCQVSLGRSAVLLDVDETLVYEQQLGAGDVYNEHLVRLAKELPPNVDEHLFTDMASTDLQKVSETAGIRRPQVIYYLGRVGMVITPADILPADMGLDVLAQFRKRMNDPHNSINLQRMKSTDEAVVAAERQKLEGLLAEAEFAPIKAVVDAWRAGGITGEPGRAWTDYMSPAFEAFYADHAKHYNADRTAKAGFAADTVFGAWRTGARKQEIDQFCDAFDNGKFLADVIATYLNCHAKDLMYRIFLPHAQQRGYRAVCLFDDREDVRQGVEQMHRAHGGEMALTCVPVDCRRDSAETYAAAMRGHMASIADPCALRQYFLTDPQLADLYIRGQILGALYRARDAFATLQLQQPQPRAGRLNMLARSISAVFAKPTAPATGPDTIIQQWIDRFQSCATIDEYYRHCTELMQYVNGVLANPLDQKSQEIFGDLLRTITQVPSQWQYNRLVNTYNPICVMNPNIIFSGTENLAIASLVCHSWRENIKESDRTVHTIVPGHLSHIM